MLVLSAFNAAVVGLASAGLGLAGPRAALITMRPEQLRAQFGWAPLGVTPKNEDKALKVWNALRKGFDPLESSEGIPEIIPPVRLLAPCPFLRGPWLTLLVRFGLLAGPAPPALGSVR